MQEKASTMLIIGLTGPSGAGKGLFSQIMQKKYGIDSIDADEVYHALLIPPSPCLDQLCERFGKEILSPSGMLDRPTLARIVFSPEDASKREKQINDLNAITHRFVLAEIERLLFEAEKKGVRCVILDAPALYESGADKMCELLVTVTADKDTRVSRITERDGLPEEAARFRIRGQKDDGFYKRRADAVLYNDGTPEEFDRTVSMFYDTYVSPRL